MMVVWGIGAKWCDEKLTDDFLLNKCISVGWSREDAPDLYAMCADININDIIYIKSFVPKNRQLNVYAVGIVRNTIDEHDEVNVEWFADMTSQPFAISLNEIKGKNNVYSNTLYREYNEKIVSLILNHVKNQSKERGM